MRPLLLCIECDEILKTIEKQRGILDNIIDV